MIALSGRGYSLAGAPRHAGLLKTLVWGRCIATSRAVHQQEGRKPLHRTRDRRLEDFGPVFEDQYANIRDKYQAPKNPIVLAHGLLGFTELHLAGSALPGVQYWRGIIEALRARGVEVFTAAVPPSGSIEERAEALREGIARQAAGRQVNVIAGLDSRYMISRLKPSEFTVLSLTTIATPHRGSEVADHIFKSIGRIRTKQIFSILKRLHVPTGAFTQLTREHLTRNFNPATPDASSVRYFSYGATVTPGLLSPFRAPHRILAAAEGPNDGLVSVASAVWGAYRGTIVGASHLDLINWSNRLVWWVRGLLGQQRGFNGVAFYLGVADMLAREGL